MTEATFKRRHADDGEHQRPVVTTAHDGGPRTHGLVAVPGLLDATAPLRRLADDPIGGSTVTDGVTSALRRRRGQGEAMPDSLTQGFGDHFGMDLSAVRIHSDGEAGQLASSLHATAFTHGNDIYFAPGAYQPDSPGGRHVLAHELSHVHAQRTGADRGVAGPLSVGRADDPAEAAADQSATAALSSLRRSTAPATPYRDEQGAHTSGLTREAGSSPYAAELRRWPWSRKSKDDKGAKVSDEYPRTIQLDSEQVVVEKKEDEAEAKQIVKILKSKYGIQLSSAKTIAGIKGEYTKVDTSVTDQLSATAWTMNELRALKEGASYYAPILGSKRKRSTLGKKAQGVTSIGKLKNAINDDSATGKLDTSTLGEYFGSQSNMGMFSAGTNYRDDEFVRPGAAQTDVSTSLTATAIHEMAHGLVQPYELNKWVAKLAYWLDEDTESGTPNAEMPPTDYGETNAAEDLCESVAMFFVNREALKSKCPERESFVAAVVAAWTPAKKKKAVSSSTSAKGSEKPPAPKSGATVGDKVPVGVGA